MTDGWAPRLAGGPDGRWVSADEHSLHVWSGAVLERSVDLSALLGGAPRVLSAGSALAGRFAVDLGTGAAVERLSLDRLLDAYDPQGDEHQLAVREVAWTADGRHALAFVEYRPTRLRGGSDAARPGAILVLAEPDGGPVTELDRGRYLVAAPLAGDRWLVSGGDRWRVVDPADARVVLDVEPDDPATAVATAGDLVVAGCSGGEVLGAAVADGAVSRRWADHDAVVDAVALSSAAVASGDRDGHLVVRPWAGGDPVLDRRLPGPIDGLCFLADDHLVVAVGGTVGEIQHVELDGAR